MKKIQGRLVCWAIMLAVMLGLVPERAWAKDTKAGTATGALIIYGNDGKRLKQFTSTSGDYSLEGTGLEGSVTDGGDHWSIHVTGGRLSGAIHSKTGLEIHLAGEVGISNTSNYSAVHGKGEVRISGPGVLHIDHEKKDAPAIDAESGSVIITLGAMVGVNSLASNAKGISGKGVRVLASLLHVNAVDSFGIYCNEGDLEIDESVVTVCSSKAAIHHRKEGKITVTASSVHLVSTQDSALRCGEGTITKGAASISVVDSVFCLIGAQQGIQGCLMGNRTDMAFHNVVGAILGSDCGIHGTECVTVGGGATKLSIAGNLFGEYTLEGREDRALTLASGDLQGMAVSMQSARAYFGVEAGSVKLFAPGTCALACGTNAVTAGKLEVPESASYGDFQTLFTWTGALAAMQVVAGGTLVDPADDIVGDFFEAQALEQMLTPTAALFAAENGRHAFTGIKADMVYVGGGEVSVEASGTGILLGGNTGFLLQEGGKTSVNSKRVAIADATAAGGATSTVSSDYGIRISGGRMDAKGRQDGLLTSGWVWMDGGTLEAAATGGQGAGTISANPGLTGYALGANYGFAIDGGSFVATGGELRQSPNASAEHGSVALHPCDLEVPGADAGTALAVSGMVPSWYGVNDLFPIGGTVRFWLPIGSASLSCGGKEYAANGTGSVVAGANRFVAAVPPISLSSISISGPESVVAGESAAYACTAKYSDGSGGRVSAAWSVADGGSRGNIGADGTFTAKATATSGSVTIRAEFGGLTAEKTIRVTVAAATMQTVTFDPNGGSCTTATHSYEVGKPYGWLPTPTRTGIAFAGWFTARAGGTQITTGSTVTASAARTLYAHWTEEATARMVEFSVGTSTGRMFRGVGEAGKTYRLEWTPGLLGPWETVQTMLAAGDGSIEGDIGLPDWWKQGFYRLVEGEEAAKEERYLVVDMSGGASATRWPVNILREIPAGGWTDEYKTEKLVLRQIPPGTFVMGSPTNYYWRDESETQHGVALTKGFYIGVFEVTQRQWELAMGTRPSAFTNDADYAMRPVEWVCYDDIRGENEGSGWPTDPSVGEGSFLSVLRAKTGLAFDLPTEAQWEYACRAGSEEMFSIVGEVELGDILNYETQIGRCGQSYLGYDPAWGADKGTAKAGSYLPNPWGLYDCNGNVWELCLDWFGEYPEESVFDPVGPVTGEYRAIRGGSWYNDVHFCTSAFRGSVNPPGKAVLIGFRLACPAEEPK